MQNKKRFSITERKELVDKASQCVWMKDGTTGRDYLFGRKISEEAIRDLSLGYIPDYVHHQLRGRIILPVFDPTGNLVAIGSRALGKSDFLPVYWHESYEKQFYLYGIHRARSEMRKFQFAVVVEGQFDFLQAYSRGVKNIVALCGNKISDVQVSVIQRYCNDIVLVLDTDENQAGQMGAQKAMAQGHYDVGPPQNFNKTERPAERYTELPVDDWSPGSVRREIISVSFPENCDPDEYIQTHGIDEFKKIVKGKLYEMRNERNA
jgi:DNA primase